MLFSIATTFNPAVLCILIANNKLKLESDTSKTANRAVLLQFQHSQWIIIDHLSKKLQQAVQNYGIMELKLTGFVCSICGFSQLLKHHNYEELVDHKLIKNLQKGVTRRVVKLI